MPGFDRKGPNSEGPMTGRGLGKCNPETRDNLNMINETPGRGRRFRGGYGPGNGKGNGPGNGRGIGRGDEGGAGRGRGRGRGLGRGFGRSGN